MPLSATTRAQESHIPFTISNLLSVTSQQCLRSPKIFRVKDYTSARQEKKENKNKNKNPIALIHSSNVKEI